MPVVYSMGTGLPVGSGSVDLVLDPVQQLGYEQVPVWDGPTYLYTINRLHFRGVYNPARFAWNFGHQEPLGGNFTGDYPVLSPGSSAPDTNVAIRHFLMQPRGTLSYNIGGTVQPIPAGSNVVIVGGRYDIIVPTTIKGADENDAEKAYTIDCKNGPVPLHCNVVEVRGQKTYIVDWAIEFYVNESYIFRKSTTLSALLSQRWTVEEDLDEDFFATRTIVGHAIFRSDRLQVLNAVADDFRAWLMNPVQNNFQRTVQQIIISEDGTRLDYVLVDREKPFNLTPSVIQRGVTRIEAEYTHGYKQRLGAEEYGLKAGLLLYQIKKLNPLGSANDPLKGRREGINKLFDFLQSSTLDVIPRFGQHLVCRVWGGRGSTRAGLYQTALEVLTSKVNPTTSRLGSGGIEVTEDLMGKFIRLDCNITLGPIRSVYQAGGSFMALPVVSTNDLTPGVTQSQAYLQPAAPFDRGTRANFYAAVSQVLTGADDTSPRPNNNREDNSLDPQGFEF